MSKNTRVFLQCCYGYMVSGMAVLMIGAILPLIMEEANFNFTQAGLLLSMMAIGNLTASICFPLLTKTVGRSAIVIITAFVPLCFGGILLLPPLYIFYLLMILLGISRGSVTIINNAVVSNISGNSPKMLNLLHCSFAVGAFLAPFITALMIQHGLGWRIVLGLLIILCSTSVISYAQLVKMQQQDLKRHPESQLLLKKIFKQEKDFYLIGLLLFFYLGIENCINGWFVSYLQNTGVMSNAYATIMVSVTWLVIMAGRITFASLTNRFHKTTLITINAIGGGIGFFLLVSTKNIVVITAALICLGFFLSGIFPTAIAYAGDFLKHGAMGMSLLTAMSALGGIITPQLIGILADRQGIVASISLLSANILIIIMLSLLQRYREGKKQAKTS